MKTSLRSFAVVAGISMIALNSLDANAAGVRVRCEVRSDRSVASVDGRGLVAGQQYRARVISGGRRVESGLAAANADGEAEFDFSSQANDIAAGATAIRSTFIKNATLTGRIYDAEGFAQAGDQVTCRSK